MPSRSIPEDQLRCSHPRTRPMEDHLRCSVCGAVKTDGGDDWGEVKRTWFGCYHDAKKARVQLTPPKDDARPAGERRIAMKQIRGIRNNNPGNLKHSTAFTWDGELEPDAEGFCRFENPYYGIRAMAKVLITYYYKHNIKTIEGIIKRYSATDQESYIASVCRTINRLPTEEYNFTSKRRLTGLMRAMIKVECSYFPYSFRLLRDGIDFALEP